MTNALMIEAHGLTKRYGSTVALDGLDLEVPTGAILGVLGPNGAGKSTAVRILTTLAQPDSGSARVAGHDVVTETAAVQRSIGVTAQDATLDEVLTGRQNLVMIGRLSGLTRSAGQGPSRRAARPLRAVRRRRPHPEDLLRRHAAAAGSGRRTRHPAAGDLPRRADHRPRSHQPGADVGRDPRAGRRRRDAAADHPVPGRGRRAGRSHRGHRPRPRHRHSARPPSSRPRSAARGSR